MLPDILKAEELARSLLLNQKQLRLPVDARRLFHHCDIIITSIQQFCHVTNVGIAQLCAGSDCIRDGCTIIHHRRGKRIYLVLYNEDTHNTRRRGFTVAHELGHIYLGHDSDGDIQETEANRFAAELLVPRSLAIPLIRQSSGFDPAQELCGVFGVSLDMARQRMRTLNPSAGFAPAEKKLFQLYGGLLPRQGEPVVGY